MKALIGMILITLFTIGEIHAQKVPRLVKESFRRKYGKVENLVWRPSAGGNYLATFTQKNHSMISIFHLNGKWVRTIVEMEQEQIPVCASKYISDTYFKTELLSAVILESERLNQMEINIKVLPKKQSDEEYFLTIKFDEDCNITETIKRFDPGDSE